MPRVTRQFSDTDVLKPGFPDVRLMSQRPAEHRRLRHIFYRKQVADEKAKTAIIPFRQSWIAILYRLLNNVVDAEEP